MRRVAGWTAGGLALLVVVWTGGAAIAYSPEYVWRVLTHGMSEQSDYLDFFPLRELTASPTPAPFASAPDERVEAVLAEAFGTDDVDALLADTGTQAFLVIRDDTIVFERYLNGAAADSELTSFSVAKSFVSVLVGIAVDEGAIGSVEDPITDYLPELLEVDERLGEITIEHLLTMSSGLEYEELRWALLNGDDPITTYHPDQRWAALHHTAIVEPPGQHFRYDKYHPQLLGMILERATGETVTEFTQTRLWDPLGMEHDGAWALDDTDGFEKMEAGLNARAVDYAKLGRLVLGGGAWDGRRVVSEEWMTAATALDPATHDADHYSRSFGPAVYDDGAGYYGWFWYGYLRDDGPPDVAAEGDRGQFVYVSPSRDLIIVRNGTEYGIPWARWVEGLRATADGL